MIAIILAIYFAIALFMCSVLMYAVLTDEGKDPDRPVTRSEKFGIAFVIPALWPLSIAMLVGMAIHERIQKKYYSIAKKILYTIDNDFARLGELSVDQLKIVVRGMRSGDRFDREELMKVEQELLNRMVEKHLL